VYGPSGLRTAVAATVLPAGPVTARDLVCTFGVSPKFNCTFVDVVLINLYKVKERVAMLGLVNSVLNLRDP
jgi:hypothetical protein